MKRLTAVALVAAAVWFGGGVRPEADAAAQYSRDWRRLRSNNFTALGNTGFRQMRDVLLELEGFRRALLRTFAPVDPAPSVPTVVVVFKDDRSFAPFKPRDASGDRRDAIAGFFLSGPTTNYMAVAMQRDVTRTFQYLFHEYTHYVVRSNMAAPPNWLNEGLAEFFSTFQAHPREGYAVIGRPPYSRLGRLRAGRLMPLRDLFAVRQTLDIDGDRAAAFYAQSWALVHYVVLGDNGRLRAKLPALVEALAREATADRAVQTAFGLSLDDLERRLWGYGRRDGFEELRIDDPAGGLPVRTIQEVMLETEVEAMHRELLDMVNHSSRRP
jgi:hypothetical protein